MVSEFGCLANISSGTVEHNHTFGAKQPAENTQKCFTTLEAQSAECLFESNIINVAGQHFHKKQTHRLDMTTVLGVSPPKAVGGSWFKLVLFRNHQSLVSMFKYSVVPMWSSKRKPKAVYTRPLHNAYAFAMQLCQHLIPLEEDGTKQLSCFCEHQHDRGIMF